MHRQENEPRRQPGLTHLMGGLNSVEYWHRYVQHNHVRLKPLHFSNQISSVVNRPDYVKVWL